MPLKDIIVGSIVLLSMSVFFLLYTFGFIHRFIWWMCERKKKKYRQECEKLDWVKTIREEMARTQEKLDNAHFDEED